MRGTEEPTTVTSSPTASPSRRTRPSPATAVRSPTAPAWTHVPLSREKNVAGSAGCPAGRNETREDRGHPGDEEREAHRDGRRCKDHQIGETGKGRKRYDRMRGDDAERGSEDRSREGEDDGLRLVDSGHGDGGRAET